MAYIDKHILSETWYYTDSYLFLHILRASSKTGGFRVLREHKLLLVAEVMHLVHHCWYSLLPCFRVLIFGNLKSCCVDHHPFIIIEVFDNG